MKFDIEEMHRLAGLYFAGGSTAEEEQELFHFVAADPAHRQQFDAWRHDWEEFPVSGDETANAWRRLQARMHIQQSAAHTVRLNSWWRAAAAAVIFSTAFLGARWYDHLLLKSSTEYYTVVTKANDKSVICLPDGTQIRLNGASTLTYPTNFNATNRRVELSGGAFFDVSHDESHPFEVKVGDCSVTVKGTKFDISAYGEDSSITTTLLEGRVVFSSPAGTTGLTPGEALAYDRISEATTISRVDTDQYLAWIEGHVAFIDVTIVQLCESLSTLFGVKITLDSRLQESKTCITIRLNNQESLDSVLKALSLIVPVSVQREGLAIHLSAR